MNETSDSSNTLYTTNVMPFYALRGPAGRILLCNDAPFRLVKPQGNGFRFIAKTSSAVAVHCIALLLFRCLPLRKDDRCNLENRL